MAVSSQALREVAAPCPMKLGLPSNIVSTLDTCTREKIRWLEQNPGDRRTALQS